MQLNSYIFILLFLPIFVVGFFLLNKINVFLGKLFIILAGAVFYLYAGINISIIFGISIVINYLLALIIKKVKKKWMCGLAIVANVGLLIYFKYYNFIILTINDHSTKQYPTKDILLPLGISFFTFQQIMYLVNLYKDEIKEAKLTDYLAYILYFPKLIMGPLAEPKEIIDQINDKENKKIKWDNVAAGLRLFSYGLFKKVVLADTFAKVVKWGFTNPGSATAGDLFLIMIFYTFEIYFDFSGYTDMAVGVSNMINISLPINFNSPYKATSIRDFWKRWHMSLTAFLTKYIYFPLGGSKKGVVRTYLNILLVFIVSGLWHGANWTFILWGLIHGGLQILERVCDKVYNKLFDVAKWMYTFFAVNILWLLFRAESIQQWKEMLIKMFSFQNMAISDEVLGPFPSSILTFLFERFHLTTLSSSVRGLSMIIYIVAAYVICLVPENNYKTSQKTNYFNVVTSAIAFIWAFLCLTSESVFVYFNF